MRYWSKQRFRVIVCDGSDISQDKRLRDSLAQNIKYIHSLSPFPQRIKMAADMVGTRYCIFLPDDEFYSPTALNECIDFLDKNEEYVAAGGVAVGFGPGDKEVLGYPAYPKWIGRERLEVNPQDRVVAHMSSYANYLSVSVTRSQIWKTIADLYASQELPIYALWELEMSLILSYYGKSKVLNNLMYFRSIGEAIPVRNKTPSLSNKNFLCDVWQSNNHLGLRKKFVSIIAGAFEEFSRGEFKTGSEKMVVEDAIDAYCELTQGGVMRRHFISVLKKIIPVSIRKRLKLVIASRRNHPTDNQKTLEDTTRDLELMGVNVDRNDVIGVISSINEFYGYG
jgi:glycosyltransferase domain-containing protein